MFLQGCQNLYAQMLLVLQAKCSINKKYKLLHLLQCCKYILVCIIFVVLVTLNILKGGGCLSSTEQFFLCRFIYINCLSRDSKKKAFTILVHYINLENTSTQGICICSIVILKDAF